MSIFHLWEIYPLIYRCELIYSEPILLPLFSNLRSHQCHFDDVCPEDFLIMSIFHLWEIYKCTLYIDELNEFEIVILLPYKAMYVLLCVVSMMYLLRYIKRNFWGSVCHYIASPYSNIHSPPCHFDDVSLKVHQKYYFDDGISLKVHQKSTKEWRAIISVSYTHLTLPTILLV